uniref:GA26198 n=1 Tax=Drosophila miranda TaxID=7229 RepID=D0QWN1_DROMI|nr:GA26198 [Drosophila miranda]
MDNFYDCQSSESETEDYVLGYAYEVVHQPFTRFAGPIDKRDVLARSLKAAEILFRYYHERLEKMQQLNQ